MQIPVDVLAVLDERATTEGHGLRIGGQRLDPKMYQRVNKTLEAAGGKWNRKTQSHLFDSPAADVLDAILSTGEVISPRDFGYFPTPPPVVARLIQLAGLRPGMTVLEPSAGRGAIAGPMASLGCIVNTVELLPENAAHLTQELLPGGLLVVGDFLEMAPLGAYDRVVMNPPFAKQADIAHVTHAHEFLKPGGLLVAVMSNGVTFRSGRAAEGFRALRDSVGGYLEPLPEGSFQVSGTGVSAVIVVLPAGK